VRASEAGAVLGLCLGCAVDIVPAPAPRRRSETSVRLRELSVLVTNARFNDPGFQGLYCLSSYPTATCFRLWNQR